MQKVCPIPWRLVEVPIGHGKIILFPVTEQSLKFWKATAKLNLIVSTKPLEETINGR